MTSVSKNNSLKKNFSQILDYYGFIQEDQKKSLENLLHLSGILPISKSLDEYYAPKDNNIDLLEDILDFVEKTQQHLIIRKEGQERWEAESVKWIEQNKRIIIKNAMKLGFTNKIPPSAKHYDALIVLGSNMPSMQTRIDYVANLLDINSLSTKYLILLAGERNVALKIDGKKAELKKISQIVNIKLDELTETHLLWHVYKNSSLYNAFPTFVIDTPANNLSRPTTETTLVQFAKWLQQYPDIRKVIFVSNQPWVKYQSEVINQILKNMSPNPKFEVIGNNSKENNKALSLLEAIGSYIWAKTLEIIPKLGENIKSKKLKTGFMKLYNKNFFLYSNIENLF